MPELGRRQRQLQGRDRATEDAQGNGGSSAPTEPSARPHEVGEWQGRGDGDGKEAGANGRNGGRPGTAAVKATHSLEAKQPWDEGERTLRGR